MMSFAMKGRSSESRSKNEKMSKKMSTEEQMYKRKLSLSKVQVASSPSETSPAANPKNCQGSIVTMPEASDKADALAAAAAAAIAATTVTSAAKPPPTTTTTSSPMLASSSSSSSSSRSAIPAHINPARRNSRIQLLPFNSINMGSPRTQAVSSPLTRARKNSLAPSSPMMRGRAQSKFSINFLRMHNERKAQRAEAVALQQSKQATQDAIVENINLLEQRLAELQKQKSDLRSSEASQLGEAQRVEAATRLLQQLGSEVPAPVLAPGTKSTNNRMQEEDARRAKKKMAAEIIHSDHADAGVSLVRDHELLAEIERQERLVERELTKLRAQCVESNSRVALMREEKQRRDERKRVRALERRGSSSASPRLRFNKSLPPVRNGLFIKAVEAAKLASQGASQSPKVLTRFGRMAGEKARRAQQTRPDDATIPE